MTTTLSTLTAGCASAPEHAATAALRAQASALIRAYSLASAPVIAPWTYMQLMLSVSIGWLVFDAVPDTVTLVGMAIIGLAPQLTRLSKR